MSKYLQKQIKSVVNGLYLDGTFPVLFNTQDRTWQFTGTVQKNEVNCEKKKLQIKKFKLEIEQS